MYDPKNAKETSNLAPDSILDGEITEIKDGTVKDFIVNLDKWKGSKEQRAINVSVRCKEVVFDQIFTYTHDQGQMKYLTNSNLGKYNRKYGKLPEVGDKVKVTTNKEGFGKIKID